VDCVPEQAVIALDVGGTTVDSACVSAAGAVIGEPPESGSPAARPKDEIVRQLARIIDATRALADDFSVSACGIAMPAPFDYAAGVSYMKHKFQALYGVNLGALLREKTGLPVYFINDADAFGLGVGWRQLPDTKRFVALTIGTGLGGSFIEDGEVLDIDPRVPKGGEVWDLPFEDGILEDYASARAVTALYDKLKPDDKLKSGARRSAKEVSALALRGSQPAIDAYREMGTALGRGLGPVFVRFRPEKVVIGGHVGRSLELFGPAMEQALAAAGVPEVPILHAAPGNMAIFGAARYSLTRVGSGVGGDGAGGPIRSG
jgi:predicted NBD/HSP70 family sugar kinase